MTSAERMRKYRQSKKNRGEIEVRLFFEQNIHEMIMKLAEEHGITFYEVIKRAITTKGVTSDVTSDAICVTSDGDIREGVTSDDDSFQVIGIPEDYRERGSEKASRVTDDQNNIYYINNIYTEYSNSTEGSEVLTPWQMDEAVKSNEGMAVNG